LLNEGLMSSGRDSIPGAVPSPEKTYLRTSRRLKTHGTK
jgi:hypothetical protein